MEKKKIAFYLVLFVFIFVWLFIVGQVGSSGLRGDINLLDEGQFGAWAEHILHGKVAYKEIYIQYGPLLVLPVVYLMKLFGQTMFVVRLWGIITTFLGVVIAIVALREFKANKVVSTISILAFLVIPGINIRQWLGILCLLFLVKSAYRASLLFSFLSGIILTLILFESVDIFIFTSVITTVYFVIRLVKENKLNTELKILSSFLSGFIISAAGFSLFFWHLGWLGGYIQQAQDIAFSVSGMNLPNGQGLPVLLPQNKIGLASLVKLAISKSALFYWSLFIILIFFAVGLLFSIQHKVRARNGLFLMICVFSIFEYLSIIGRSGHYFVVVPFVIVLSAYIVNSLEISKKLGLFCMLIFICYVARHLAVFRYNLLPNFANTAVVSRVSPLKISTKQAAVISALQRFFSQNTNKSDQIYILNNDPGLYLLLDRQNPTQYDLPLLAGTIDKRLQIVSDLSIVKPKYIIEDKGSWAVDGVSDKNRMPEVFDFVKKQYHQSKKIGDYTIYTSDDFK